MIKLFENLIESKGKNILYRRIFVFVLSLVLLFTSVYIIGILLLCILILVFIAELYPDSKFILIIKILISIFLIPFTIVAYNYGFFFIIFALMYWVPRFAFDYCISNSSILFTALTAGFTLNVYFYKPLFNRMLKFVEYPFYIKLMKRFYTKDLVLLYVYMTYFIALVLLNFTELNNYDFLDTNYRINKAVLQSFATFLALERAIKYYKENIENIRMKKEEKKNGSC